MSTFIKSSKLISSHSKSFAAERSAAAATSALSKDREAVCLFINDVQRPPACGRWGWLIRLRQRVVGAFVGRNLASAPATCDRARGELQRQFGAEAPCATPPCGHCLDHVEDIRGPEPLTPVTASNLRPLVQPTTSPHGRTASSSAASHSPLASTWALPTIAVCPWLMAAGVFGHGVCTMGVCSPSVFSNVGWWCGCNAERNTGLALPIAATWAVRRPSLRLDGDKTQPPVLWGRIGRCKLLALLLSTSRGFSVDNNRTKNVRSPTCQPASQHRRRPSLPQPSRTKRRLWRLRGNLFISVRPKLTFGMDLCVGLTPLQWQT